MQGFRKIDTDRWEFANEGFVRGQRHLLKTIQRRRSNHSHPQQVNEDGECSVEVEISELKKERRSMMQEVMGLQHEQLGTIQKMEVVKEKLEAAEVRHKQLISFLARMVNNPTFSTHLRRSITSPRTVRRFVKHEPHELVPCSSTENQPQDELGEADEFVQCPENGDLVQTLVQEDGVTDPPLPSSNEPLVENHVDEWNMGFEASDPWGYPVPDLGFSDFAEIGSLQLEGSSGIKNWFDEEYPASYL